MRLCVLSARLLSEYAFSFLSLVVLLALFRFVILVALFVVGGGGVYFCR